MILDIEYVTWNYYTLSTLSLPIVLISWQLFLIKGTLRRRYDNSLWRTELPFPCRVGCGVDPILPCPITGSSQPTPRSLSSVRNVGEGQRAAVLGYRACSDGAFEIPCIVSYQFCWKTGEKIDQSNI